MQPLFTSHHVAGEKLPATALGFKMLQNMGWKAGSGLGKLEDGMTSPVGAGRSDVITLGGRDKRGLRADSETIHCSGKQANKIRKLESAQQPDQPWLPWCEPARTQLQDDANPVMVLDNLMMRSGLRHNVVTHQRGSMRTMDLAYWAVLTVHHPKVPQAIFGDMASTLKRAKILAATRCLEVLGVIPKSQHRPRTPLPEVACIEDQKVLPAASQMGLGGGLIPQNVDVVPVASDTGVCPWAIGMTAAKVQYSAGENPAMVLNNLMHPAAVQVSFRTITSGTTQGGDQAFAVECTVHHPSMQPIVSKPASKVKLAKVLACMGCLAALGVVKSDPLGLVR